MKFNILVAITSVLIPAASSALLIDGITHTGMRFHGRIVESDDTSLGIREVQKMASHMIGIPYSDIQEISLKHDAIDLSLLKELEPHTELLPLLNPDSLNSIMSGIYKLAEQKDWAGFYQWTVLLIAAGPPWEINLRLRLWKAWAYHEMKLFPEAHKQLEEIVQEWDPLEAPALLCWLMAKLEMQRKNSSKALYWALLPSMQIPASGDAYAVELAQLAEQWLHDESIIHQ